MVRQAIKRKVLFLTGTWADFGGLNKMIATVSGMLASEYDVTVCSLAPCEPGRGYVLEKNVKYTELTPSDLYDVDKIVQDWNIDIFIGSNNCDIPYLDMYRKLSNSKVKTIMWNHEFFFLPYTQQALYKVALYRKDIYEYPDAIVWLTKTSAMACYQYSRKLVVIGNSVWRNEKNRKPVKPVNKSILNVISIGRFDSRQKGIGQLLMMFSELIKIHEESVLSIVGKYDLSLQYSNDNKETVGELLNRLNIPEDKIIFTGEIPSASSLIAESFVNVMTSEAEGFGLTVLEAAEHGVPSVVYSGGGQADVIDDGVDGAVIPYGDYTHMAKTIAGLFDDKEGYVKMRQNSLVMAKQYSTSVIKDRWMNLFDELLSERPAFGGESPSLTEGKAIAIYENLLLKRTESIIKQTDKTVAKKKVSIQNLFRSKQ